MANTYSQVSIHAVFAVKGRQNLIGSHFRDELHGYMHGILKNIGSYPLAVGGWMDHVHVLYELPMTVAISDLMRILKANSSKWVNESGYVKGHFQWQEGYSAFSCSRSHRDNTIKYIMRQEQHHAKRNFKEEYLEMLKTHEILYEEKYLMEFYDR